MFEQLELNDVRDEVLAAWGTWWGGIDARVLTREMSGNDTTVRFSRKASRRLEKRVFEPFEARFEKDPSDALFATVRRGMSHVQIVAALYAVTCGRWEVSEDDMQRAIELFEHTLTFTRERLPKLGQGEEAREDARGRDRIRVGLRIAAEVGLSKGELYKLLNEPTKRALESWLESLLDAGDVVSENTKAAGGRGRPSQRYFLAEYDPKLVSTQN
jgi:histone H3/H4